METQENPFGKLVRFEAGQLVHEDTSYDLLIVCIKNGGPSEFLRFRRKLGRMTPAFLEFARSTDRVTVTAFDDELGLVPRIRYSNGVLLYMIGYSPNGSTGVINEIVEVHNGELEVLAD